MDPDQLDEAELGSFVRRIEGTADRDEDLLRVERGTFVHRAHLPHSATAEHVVDWCLRRRVGETGPLSTLVLLDELREASVGMGDLNHCPLKDLLCQRPDIRKLRKTFVAYAATFDEEDMDIEACILAVLSAAERPLDVQKVMDRLPEGVR